MSSTTGTEGGKRRLWASANILRAQHHQPHTPVKRAVWADKKGGIAIIKPNRSLADQVFGIGNYRYSKDGQLYFVHGNTRIKVREHFCTDGKPLSTLLENVIQFSVKQQEHKIRTDC